MKYKYSNRANRLLPVYTDVAGVGDITLLIFAEMCAELGHYTQNGIVSIQRKS